MRRTACSLLVLLCLLIGLVMPVFAEQEPQPLSETMELTEQATEPETEQPSEPEQPTEAELPVETEQPAEEERPQTRAVTKMKVSEQGLAFIREMMYGSVGTNQLAAAEQAVNSFMTRYDMQLKQTQFDALADLALAYGGSILSSGWKVEKVIASGRYYDAELASAFCAWVRDSSGVSQQLLQRRLREIKLFLYGSYDGICTANFRYLIFYPNGGKLEDNSVLCYAYNQAYGTLPKATREGYYFTGWYLTADGAGRRKAADLADNNYALYAGWSTEEPEEEFDDVPANAWYSAYVRNAVKLGLFNGMGDGLFAPNDATTRAMLTTVLWRRDGKTEAETAPFTDVPASQWYTAAVNWAYQAGVVKGMEETLFAPDLKITREQLVTMLYRYAQQKEGYQTELRAELTAFSDASEVSDYAAEAIQWAVAAKIMNGDGGKLRPQGNATRAECAKLLVCFVQLTETLPFPIPEPDPVPDPEPTPEPDPTPTPPVLRTSEAGIQFIKDHEGFIKYAIWDYAQWSIGYGTRCEENEFPDGITEEEADYRLRLMMVDFETSLNALEARFGRTFSQQEYDALISFTFNLGAGWMSNTGSDTYKMLKNNSFTEMEFVNTLGLWINAGGQPLNGLASRRMDEANLYLHGEYLRGCKRYLRLAFQPNEGECEKKYYYYMTGQTLGDLPVPTREGYTFLGWYDRMNGGELFTADTVAPDYGNYTLYARWQQG